MEMNESVKDVTWILVKLLSLFGQSLLHRYRPPANRLGSTQRARPVDAPRFPALSISFTTAPFYTSTRRSRVALVSLHTCLFLLFFFPFSSSGGQEICGWWCSSWSKAWQIKRLSTSQGILWLRKESCCPLPESDSLITVERMNLKRGGRGVLCLPAMSYNWCLYIDIHMMDI